jgi:hypothetical protein
MTFAPQPPDGPIWGKAMGVIRLRVRRGAEAERFNAAYYQFVNAHARSADRAAESWILKTARDGEQELKIATLWSQRAASRFLDFWNDSRGP